VSNFHAIPQKLKSHDYFLSITPVPSSGATPVKRQQQRFHRAGGAGANIGPRLNIRYGFNPDGIKRKINSIGQAGQAKKSSMHGYYLYLKYNTIIKQLKSSLKLRR